MKNKTLTLKVSIPAGVTVTITPQVYQVHMKGPKGEVSRQFRDKTVHLEVQDSILSVSAAKATKREKTRLGSIESHLRNMIKGVTQGHVYKMKICSGHFPMNAAVSGMDLSIKNFLGEKYPRVLRIRDGVTVKVNGQDVTVEGVSLEQVSQCAADIERLTIIQNRDRRIFQDGIYIVDKDGHPVEL
ncbi:50S ribosomal protein L6 [Candidatus Woesearchaeota archaeon]|nr:50S ribosomal protein L6 [Candidatus Woesearchaeota archaeon]